MHAWDECTAAEETLRALDDLIRSGNVPAVGVSNTPAWVIARSQAIAELRGWSAYCGLQIEYSLVARSPDGELLPMARALGLTVTAWSPSRAACSSASAPLPGSPPPRRQALNAVTEIAAETGLTPARVALAWVLRQGLLPVLDTRTRAPVARHDFLYDRRTALAPPKPEPGDHDR
ncbi:aldo/keto reductase [Streptomyces mirabilis]|uniref:aldo/keto reductase n=1 Tax=Streptomyces mirabilis TaxID=68239 RepID=UPI002E304EF4|nr:aldo/keto reductase [Streptomyces mirabilis]